MLYSKCRDRSVLLNKIALGIWSTVITYRIKQKTELLVELFLDEIPTNKSTCIFNIYSTKWS